MNIVSKWDKNEPFASLLAGSMEWWLLLPITLSVDDPRRLVRLFGLFTGLIWFFPAGVIWIFAVIPLLFLTLIEAFWKQPL
jgi:hypothetical protein